MEPARDRALGRLDVVERERRGDRHALILL
jgi:hypothetical protein